MGQTVVHVQGEVDMATAPAVRAAIEDAARREAAAEVVVDLGAVRFMDSAGLLTLREVQRRLVDDGRHLTLRRPSPPVRRLLDLMGGFGLPVEVEA